MADGRKEREVRFLEQGRQALEVHRPQVLMLRQEERFADGRKVPLSLELERNGLVVGKDVCEERNGEQEQHQIKTRHGEPLLAELVPYKKPVVRASRAATCPLHAAAPTRS